MVALDRNGLSEQHFQCSNALALNSFISIRFVPLKECSAIVFPELIELQRKETKWQIY